MGPTPAAEVEPRTFWPPDVVVEAVRHRVDRLRARNEHVDFLTFVPDGEPTLDRNLGEEIEGLRSLGIPIAVISNGFLVWRADVRARLGKADWVSLRVDAADEATWRSTNRPQASLALATVIDGMLQCAAEFQGELATETMLTVTGRSTFVGSPVWKPFQPATSMRPTRGSRHAAPTTTR